ncbi:c-type cytochrome [Hydrogenophaga sp. BPS33]|uniref:c-type cytochrome n=1 Tax=Hydrogenophaga sp. BPS33 TaxID=2651974 RepID=UPI00131F8D51|nr:c-type cytochrome [Hydrogenophaga sp. BPS33]QHE84971.1 c-type cytochrome [Hydrogenophaga sp. BPS33]
MREHPLRPLNADEIWTGLVLRPADARWDGTRYSGAAPAAIDRSALAPLGPVRVVHQGGFVAVAAPSAELAHAAAARLTIPWQAPAEVALPASATAHPGTRDGTRQYAWPTTAMVAAGTQAVAVWSGAGELDIEAEAVNPHRLRAELARWFDIAPAQVRITTPPHAVHTAEGHDAALDAAMIARAIGQPVRVTSTPASGVPTLAVQLHRSGEARWRMTPTWPLAARPGWSAMAMGTAGTVATTPVALTHQVAMPYALDIEQQPALRSLTPVTTVLPRDADIVATFALESFADEEARAAGRDPIEWRLHHLQDGSGRALVQAVAQRAGWFGEPGGDAQRAAGVGRGFALAHTVDTDAERPVQAWSAWVVDVKVDAQAGRIELAGLTVGHHVEGMHVVPTHDEDLQARIASATQQLLSGPQHHGDWQAGSTLNTPAVQVVDIVPGAQSQALTDLSQSRALMLPMAAALANAIHDATGIRLREPPFDGHALQRAQADAQGAPELATTGAPPPPSASAQSPWRRAGAWAAALATTVAGVVATAMPWRAAIAPVVPDRSLYSETAIERGRLIASAGDCVVCHTAPGGTPNAGGLAMETPFGTVYSTNLTPDPKHGIGQWSYAAFERAMRHGIGRDGRHLYPAFPYTAFAKIDDNDMQSLYAYLMAQTPVAHAPPPTELPFPYGVRPLMAGWNLLFHDATPFAPNPSQSVLWNRGAYLVNGVGHCSACHTPRNALGAEKSGPLAFLSGSEVKGWDAPALNNLFRSAKPWTRDELQAYLRTGHSEQHGVAAGPMAPVIEGLAALPDRDILAMATYLTELPGQAAPAPAATQAPAPTPNRAELLAMPGQRIFEGACAACHDPGRGMPLFGVRPDLAVNNNVVLAARADNLVQVILHGIDEPANENLGYMPGFANSLNDQQVADLARYLRAEHAPQQPAWTGLENTVARLRASPPVSAQGAAR